MRRVALIDNLNHIDDFRKYRFEEASIEEILEATGGNTGNVAFVHAIEKILANPVTRINWGWNAEYVKNNFDHIVICAANQIGSHVDLENWANRISAFSLPVTIIGLGAQSDDFSEYPNIPQGTLSFLEIISKYSEKSENISVRGAYTSDVLAYLGYKVHIGGCPSLFISKDVSLGKNIALRKNNIDKIAVSAGNIWHQKSVFLEKKLCSIAESYQGSYILQHPLSMLQIIYNETEKIEESRIEVCLKKYDKFKDIDHLHEWMRKHAILFVDVANWMNFLGNYDGVIGPRYHGIALGVQKGIPGMVIEIDSRTAELSRETKIKSYSMQEFKDKSPHEIVDLLAWSEEEGEIFDQNRQKKAIEMVEFLRNNQLNPSSHLLHLCEKV